MTQNQFHDNSFGEGKQLDASLQASGSAQRIRPRDVLRDRIRTYDQASQNKAEIRENLATLDELYNKKEHSIEELHKQNAFAIISKNIVDKDKELKDNLLGWQEKKRPSEESNAAAKEFRQTLKEYIQACDDCNKLLKAKLDAKYDVDLTKRQYNMDIARRQYEDAVVKAKDARKEVEELLHVGTDVESIIKGTEREYIYNNDTPQVRQTVQETMQSFGLIDSGVPKSNQELFETLLKDPKVKVETMRTIKGAIYENHIDSQRSPQIRTDAWNWFNAVGIEVCRKELLLIANVATKSDLHNPSKASIEVNGASDCKWTRISQQGDLSHRKRHVIHQAPTTEEKIKILTNSESEGKTIDEIEKSLKRLNKNGSFKRLDIYIFGYWAPSQTSQEEYRQLAEKCRQNPNLNERVSLYSVYKKEPGTRKIPWKGDHSDMIEVRYGRKCQEVKIEHNSIVSHTIDNGFYMEYY